MKNLCNGANNQVSSRLFTRVLGDRGFNLKCKKCLWFCIKENAKEIELANAGLRFAQLFAIAVFGPCPWNISVIIIFGAMFFSNKLYATVATRPEVYKNLLKNVGCVAAQISYVVIADTQRLEIYIVMMHWKTNLKWGCFFKNK